MNTENFMASYSFFEKGGRCGKLMRFTDWQNTSLGEPEFWSPNLKTAISVCLNSQFPIIIWWSDEFIMLYNDACVRILGMRHPEAIARAGHEILPEVWDTLSVTLRTVLEFGEARASDDQLLIANDNGKSQEAYFTLSHCPIKNENGIVEGIFTTIIDRTQIVIERRLTKTFRNITKALIGSACKTEVCQRAADVFQENQYDFPFTIIYELKDSATATRVSYSGKGVSDVIAPAKIRLEEAEACWPIANVIQSHHHFLLENIDRLMTRLPSGEWRRSPDKVLLFPIPADCKKLPKLILIIGINPYCLLDDVYMKFFQLITDQIRDRISFIEKQNEMMKHALEKCARVDQELEHLRYISCHDLQEPLRKILTFTNFLNRRWINEPEGLKYLEKIGRSATRMSVLIHDLLNYASLSKHDEVKDYVDLSKALNNALLELQPIIERKTACIKTCPLPGIKGMNGQLTQLFKNLLDNSLKFNDTLPVIEIQSRNFVSQENGIAAEYVELTISDNGIGFDQKYANQAFLIFHRLHHRQFPGNGIGLTLCKKIVENHHGIITVLSQVNKGTVFRIVLPVSDKGIHTRIE